MTRSLTAALRRATRMMRPAGMTRATRSLGASMTGLMVRSALAPFAAAKPKAARVRKARAPKVGQTLGAVLRNLRAAQGMIPGMASAQPGRAVAPRIPAGAQYLARTHRSVAGSRAYKLYVPASQPTRPRGLIVMLHGCNQTPDDFAVGTHMNGLAERHGLAIAYPAQSRQGNALSCWAWFKPGNQARGGGEPAILASLARKVATEYRIGRGNVFVAGLSAGGAMAAILADTYPDVFAAAGIHSGLVRGAAHNVLTATAAMRRGGTPDGAAPAGAAPIPAARRIVFQGDADTTVHPSNAAMIVAAAVGGTAVPVRCAARSVRGRGYVRTDYAGPDDAVLVELWMLRGGGHAWSGGRAAGSFTDPKGPDASAQMVRFFLANAARK
ncbi:MAG: alpha/beta hydrolase family esterase [Gemmobacter sp.]